MGYDVVKYCYAQGCTDARVPAMCDGTRGSEPLRSNISSFAMVVTFSLFRSLAILYCTACCVKQYFQVLFLLRFHITRYFILMEEDIRQYLVMTPEEMARAVEGWRNNIFYL
jgi:hypothetical protein